MCSSKGGNVGVVQLRLKEEFCIYPGEDLISTEDGVMFKTAVTLTLFSRCNDCTLNSD